VKRLAVALVTTLLLAVTWQGCASRKATHAPGSDKKLSFTQRYDIAKYLISTGQLDVASSQLRQLERLAKTDVQRAMANEANASLYLARRELVSAEKRASAAIRSCPSLASGYRVRALTRRERGNISGAVQDFRSALVLEPDDTESLRGLADILVSQNEISQAVKVLEMFLRVDSLDARAQDAWCSSMASLLGYNRFPIEYLRTLKSDALTRGELAAILVVESEMARLEAEARSKPIAGESIRQVVDLRPNRQAGSSAGSHESADSLKLPRDNSQVRKQETSQPTVRIYDCTEFWFAPFVEKAVRLGLLDAYPDGTFRPLDTVRKGILALDLYTFLSRHCEDALTVVKTTFEKRVQGTEGRVEQSPRWGGALMDRPNLVYSDVDDSSYLWRPVVAVTGLDVMRPASISSFGIDNPLSGEETRAIARNLARVMASSGCGPSD
jgi:tetratricopeptide (TPR) repeat protein